jgi:hypothetical protein
MEADTTTTVILVRADDVAQWTLFHLALIDPSPSCARLRPHRPRRHLRARLPTDGRSVAVWTVAVAEENQGQQGPVTASPQVVERPFVH